MFLLLSLSFCSSLPTEKNGEKFAAARNVMAGMVKFTLPDGKGATFSVPGVLILQWPDRMRLEVQDPLGGTLVLMVLRGDRFWLHQKTAKANLTGPVKKLQLSYLPKAGSILWPELFLGKPSAKSSGLRFEDGQLQEWRDGSNSVRYFDYEARQGVQYPTKLEFKGPGESLTIKWEDWETVIKDEKVFEIPPADQFGLPTKALP